MLSYDDCVRFSGLTEEEIAAIAIHEHVPAMAALEMGSCLCGTAEGKRMVRRMIIEDSEEACRRGDTRTAARLGIVLHRFIDAQWDRQAETEPSSPAAGGNPPAWVCERVDAYLGAMLRHFGMDLATARQRFGPEMQVAEMCCASCTQTGRCVRFLMGAAGADTSAEFCPNGELLEELGRGAKSPE